MTKETLHNIDEENVIMKRKPSQYEQIYIVNAQVSRRVFKERETTIHYIRGQNKFIPILFVCIHCSENQ